MKNFSILIAGAMLVGCAQNSDTAQSPKAECAVPVSPATQPADKSAAPVTAVPRKDLIPFETTVDDKIYVFSSSEALTAFMSGQPQPTVIQKPNFTPKGRTLVIEAGDEEQAEQLLAAYEKQHPAPAK